MAANPTPRPSTQETILSAAERVVIRDGVVNLTLDGVAKEARLSKGGLLYHFPSKDALITAMVKRYLETVENELEENLAKETPGKGAWTRAFLKTHIAGAASAKETGNSRELYAAMIAAMLTNSELLEPLRQKSIEWQEKFDKDATDPASAAVARFATRGLWFTEVMGFGTLTPEAKQQVISKILEMVGERK
jgi:AcrR family transcriptional regulator